MRDPADIERLLAAGWIVLQGNGYVMTPAGKAALRQGIKGKTYGETLPVDSTRAMLRPSNKKKNKRKS